MTQAVLAPQGADQPAGQMDAEQGQRKGQDASEGKSRERGRPHLQGLLLPPSIQAHGCFMLECRYTAPVAAHLPTPLPPIPEPCTPVCDPLPPRVGGTLGCPLVQATRVSDIGLVAQAIALT